MPIADCRLGTIANRQSEIEETVSTALKEGDLVVVDAGQMIPGDGEIVAGVASVDESVQARKSLLKVSPDGLESVWITEQPSLPFASAPSASIVLMTSSSLAIVGLLVA